MLEARQRVLWVVLTAVACVGLLALAVRDAPPDSMAASAAQVDPELSWSEPIPVASGEAYQGPWRMNESDFRYVDAPTAYLVEGRAVGVVWVDQARKDLLFQAFDLDGEPILDAPTNVSRTPNTFSWLPRVVITEHEPMHVHVLWQEIVFSGGSHGGEIYFARSVDGGRTFSPPTNLSRTPAGAGKGRLTADRWDNGSLELAMGPDGRLHAVWTEYEGALRAARSDDGGESFSDPVTVVEPGGPHPARGPAVGVDRDGRIHLVWAVGEDPAADLRYSRSDDGGRSFLQPRTLTDTPGHADAPTLAVDGGDRVHLAFGVAEDGPVGSYRIRYGRWAADEDPEEVQWREISERHGNDFESVAHPTLGLDSGDRVYLIWELFPSRRHRPQGLGFTWSEDGGASFRPPSVVPGTLGRELGFNGSLQGLLGRKLATGEAGTIAVVNGTFNPSEKSRVRLILGRRAEG